MVDIFVNSQSLQQQLKHYISKSTEIKNKKTGHFKHKQDRRPEKQKRRHSQRLHFNLRR